MCISDYHIKMSLQTCVDHEPNFNEAFSADFIHDATIVLMDNITAYDFHNYQSFSLYKMYICAISNSEQKRQPNFFPLYDQTVQRVTNV